MTPVLNSQGMKKLRYAIIIIILLLLLLFLAHQHQACRQLKIKKEMTAVGD